MMISLHHHTFLHRRQHLISLRTLSSSISTTTLLPATPKSSRSNPLPLLLLPILKQKKYKHHHHHHHHQQQQQHLAVRSDLAGHQPPPISRVPKWESVLSTAASLYPLYVTAGGALACVKPSAFSWFVERGPTSYSCALAFIMLSMGVTLHLRDFFSLLLQRPLSILFGCAAQYTIMPAFGAIVSKALGLPPSLAVGLILLSCCPGGTASNVVTLIARGDIPLSVVMTACTTTSAVIVTPLLIKFLAGAIVPVDAVKLSISTLQVVVAPVILGSYLPRAFPAFVEVIKPYAPLLAVLVSSLLASSVFSENLVRLKSSILNAPSGSDAAATVGFQGFFYGDLGSVVLAVILLHLAGFLVGYLYASICGFKERQCRAISIEVGMQNSSLGVVLATAHFTSPMVALPCAISAVVMNIMGSSLGFIWRYLDPHEDEEL